MERFEAQVRVRYGETDQMGIAHHAQYLHWFEVGRVEFLRHHGFRYRDLEERGVRLAVMEANVQYRSPAKYDEALRVETWVEQKSPLKIKFSYRLLGEMGQLIATGSTTLASLGEDHRPRRLPGDVEEVLNRLAETLKG